MASEVRIDRLEDALSRLAQAQAHTDESMRRLAVAQERTEERVGRLEEAMAALLYDVLKREFGWEVGVLERTWQRWNGRVEAVDVFGRATDPARPARVIWIVGEAKHNLTLREVERFARQVKRARQHLVGEVYAVCFSYRARPEVRARLQELGIPLLFSYGRFAT